MTFYTRGARRPFPEVQPNKQNVNKRDLEVLLTDFVDLYVTHSI